MSFGGYLEQIAMAMHSSFGIIAVTFGGFWGVCFVLTIFGITDSHRPFDTDLNSGMWEQKAGRLQPLVDTVTLVSPLSVLLMAAIEPLSIDSMFLRIVGDLSSGFYLPFMGFIYGIAIFIGSPMAFLGISEVDVAEGFGVLKGVSIFILALFESIFIVKLSYLTFLSDSGSVVSPSFFGLSISLYSAFSAGFLVGFLFIPFLIPIISIIYLLSKYKSWEFIKCSFLYLVLFNITITPAALLLPLDVTVHGPLFLLSGLVTSVVGGTGLSWGRGRTARIYYEKRTKRIRNRLKQLEATDEADQELLQEAQQLVDRLIEPALDDGEYQKAHEHAMRIYDVLEGREAYLTALRIRNSIDKSEVLEAPPNDLDEAVRNFEEDVSWANFDGFAEDAPGNAVEVGADYVDRAIEQATEAINEKRPDDSSPNEPDDIDRIDKPQFAWIYDVDEESTSADLRKAVQKLAEAVEARDEEDYAKAIRLADEAYLATEPTLEYLLDEAKREASDAEAAFESNDFDAAIEHWQSAEDHYERALELATARDETEMATSVEDALANVRSNVENARTKRANAKMVDLSEAANEATGRGNELFEAGDYEEAMESYRTGAERYADAADVAAEHGFDDEPRLRTASEQARTGVEDCKLARGERMVEEGADLIDDDPDEAVDALDDAIAYLDGLDFERDELDTLQTEARRWHVEASTAVGRGIMEEAEDLYDDEERHAAKERYEDAKDHFRNVLDDAIEHGFTDERSAASDLVDACIENARLISEELTEVGAVEPDLEHVEDVTDATTDYSPPDRLRQPRRSEPGVEDLVRAELPDHEVLEPIGGGGNADVHKVRLAETGAVRALKRPRWHDTLSDEVTKEFVAEAETWTNVDDHEGIVTVHDWGTVPEPWILMEFVEGGNLRELVGQVDTDRAIDLLADCCTALGYAHRHGIAHTDIKPGNLLLTNDDRVKIGDWGLARIVIQHTSGREGLTTPYAAPEQIEPTEYGSPDTHTDIYQLGVVAYELLTGEVPFDYKTPSATTKAILEREPTPPSEAGSDVPGAFDDPILRALAKRRENRHESILLFRNSLREALQEV